MSLPIIANPRSPRYVAPDEPTEAQLLYDDMRRTCRKAFLYVCSANEECGNDMLVLARNTDIANQVARDHKWSVLKGLGWTCPPCARLYHHPAGAIGPRKSKKRLTVMEAWQQKLEQEHRGNDLAEVR